MEANTLVPSYTAWWPSEFSLSVVFSVADQPGGGEMLTVCQIHYVEHNPRPGTQIFEQLNLSVMSEENGRRVNKV